MPFNPEFCRARALSASILLLGSLAASPNKHAQQGSVRKKERATAPHEIMGPFLPVEQVSEPPNSLTVKSLLLTIKESKKDTQSQTASTNRPNSVSNGHAGDPGYLSSPPDSDFYRLATCESQSNWSIDTGNGYYGGVQEDITFWNTNGGLKFASSPNLASPQEQIVVARRGYYAPTSGGGIRGWTPWPTCAPRVGL